MTAASKLAFLVFISILYNFTVYKPKLKKIYIPLIVRWNIYAENSIKYKYGLKANIQVKKYCQIFLFS